LPTGLIVSLGILNLVGRSQRSAIDRSAAVAPA
jgi:hypothetical protein